MKMDTALFAGQVGIAGLSIASYTTLLDLLTTVRAGFRAWERWNGLDHDVEVFRAQVILQQDLLETWQRDWLDAPAGHPISQGRDRLLAQHRHSIERALRSISDEFASLDPVLVLMQRTGTTQRVRWLAGQEETSKKSLKCIKSLLEGLFMLLPLQSSNPEVKAMISLLSNLSTSPPNLQTSDTLLLRQGFDLRDLRASLEQDLEKRVEEFQQSFASGSKDIPRPPVDLKVEEGTAGTRSRGTVNNTPILVEWKDYGAWQGQRAIRLRGRNNNLAHLLSAPCKPEELLVFECEGYFDNIEKHQYGFVFKTPTRPGDDLISLNRLLAQPPAEWLPSLEERYQIAYSLSLSISIIHSVGWLHKGIRSHNILFIKRSNEIGWHRPYLCGFAYSRPDKQNEESEKLERSERFNLYRHPLAQGQPGEHYKQVFDVYSFGVLLFEIGRWAAAFREWEKEADHEAKKFQQELTSEKNRLKIAHRMGQVYVDVMVKCLSGHFEDKGDMTARLFFAEAVEVLGRLVRT